MGLGKLVWNRARLPVNNGKSQGCRVWWRWGSDPVYEGGDHRQPWQQGLWRSQREAEIPVSRFFNSPGQSWMRRGGAWGEWYS